MIHVWRHESPVFTVLGFGINEHSCCFVVLGVCIGIAWTLPTEDDSITE